MTRPRQFAREYAGIFRDRSVVAAYRFRPAYPRAVFEVLRGLVDADAPLAVALRRAFPDGIVVQRDRCRIIWGRPRSR